VNDREKIIGPYENDGTPVTVCHIGTVVTLCGTKVVFLTVLRENLNPKCFHWRKKKKKKAFFS
jgi:hypothetical protein